MSTSWKGAVAAAAGALLLGAGCLQGPGASPVDPFKPADQALGERIFRDPRFSQWFATHSTSVNALPNPGDPTVETAVDALGPAMPGSLAGAAMACSLCHLVEQNSLPDGTNMRAYADCARRSPIPDRGDGQSTTPRNSPPMVDALVPRTGPVFLHYDGQFVAPEDVVASTFTGRNLGWLPTEYPQALHHLAQVIREDDGQPFQGPDPSGMSYAVAKCRVGKNAATAQTPFETFAAECARRAHSAESGLLKAGALHQPSRVLQTVKLVSWWRESAFVTYWSAQWIRKASGR